MQEKTGFYDKENKISVVSSTGTGIHLVCFVPLIVLFLKPKSKGSIFDGVSMSALQKR